MMFETHIMNAMTEMANKLDYALKELSGIKALFESDYATVAEVAAIKGVSETAIRKKISNGDIDPMHDIRKNGRQTFIRRSAIHKIVVRKNS
jgi:hypothetical protein